MRQQLEVQRVIDMYSGMEAPRSASCALLCGCQLRRLAAPLKIPPQQLKRPELGRDHAERDAAAHCDAPPKGDQRAPAGRRRVRLILTMHLRVQAHYTFSALNLMSFQTIPCPT